MSERHESSRRTFIKSALAAGALGAPRASLARAAASPNDKIAIAVVGAGGQGKYAVEQAAQEHIVAFCDVDDQRACPSFVAHPDVPRFKDFRVMLDKLHKQIDASSWRSRSPTTSGRCARCARPPGTTASSPRWGTRATRSRACAGSRSGWTPA